MAYNTPSGYYDRFDPATDNNWKKILFKPGQALQSAELVELQSILGYSIDQLSSTIYRNGSIISGLMFEVDLDSLSISFSSGVIYAFGLFHEIPAGTLDITADGTERVGVLLTPEVITVVEDTDLNDPAVGYENYGKPGADRLTYSYSYTVNNDSAVMIAELIDGRINQVYNQSRPVYDEIYKVLANRTADESGHYYVEKFSLSVNDLPATNYLRDKKLKLIIEGGLGYIKGWKVENTTTSLLFDRAVNNTESVNAEVRTVNSVTTDTDGSVTAGAATFTSAGASFTSTLENHTLIIESGSNAGNYGIVSVDSGTQLTVSRNFAATENSITYKIQRWTFTTSKDHVKEMSDVVIETYADLNGTDNPSMTRGSPAGTSDEIHAAFQPVVSIIRVYDGSGDYTETTDYIVSGNHIDWSPGGSEPATGATYYIELTFNNTITQAVRTSTPVTGEDVTKGSGLSTETLSNVDCRSIGKVYEGATVYIEGTDYTVDLSLGQITWKSGGSKPSDAATYEVDYVYWAHTTEGDYISRQSFVEPISAVNEPVTRGAIGGSKDYLVYSDITSVSSVVQGPTTYVEDTDFTVNLSEGSITWIVDQNHPSYGTKYYVSYNFTRNVSKETPVKTVSGTVIDYTTDLTLDTTGEKPYESDNTSLTYDYKSVLPRKDIITVDYRGIFFYHYGEPGYLMRPPVIDEINEMPLAYIISDSEGDASSVAIEYFDNQRMTMTSLRSLLELAKELQYNQTVFQLHQETISTNTPTDKIGVWGDNLKSLALADNDNVDFSATLDSLNQVGMLPSSLESLSIPTTATGTTAQLVGNYYFLPHTEVVEISQLLASRTFNINPYTFYAVGEIELDPTSDIWHEDTESVEIIFTEDEEFSLTVDRNRIRHSRLFRPWRWKRRGSNRFLPTQPNLVDDVEEHRLTGLRRRWLRWPNRRRRLLTDVDASVDRTTTGEVISQEEVETTTVIPTAREITVAITGSGYASNEDNIQLYFSSSPVDMTPTGATIVGTTSGTVKASATGVWEATFDIPPNTPTGVHSVVASGDSTDASASFSSEGFLTETQQTITINQIETTEVNVDITGPEPREPEEWLGPPISERVGPTVNPASNQSGINQVTQQDPLAQTILAPSDFYATSIGVYFQSKDTTHPVTVEIRTTNTGFPTTTVLGSAVLDPASVNISEDASLETKFTLSNPVFLKSGEEYAIVVKSGNSTSYNVWASTLGETDVASGNQISANPYTGVLLLSANGSSWSIEQTSDLKFKLYRASFSSTSAVSMFSNEAGTNPITFTSPISRISVEAAYGLPTDQTNVQIQYSEDQSTWFDTLDVAEVDIGKAVSSLYFRAVLTGNNRVSPSLHKDGGIVDGLSFGSPGEYIWREVDLGAESARYVDIWVDIFLMTNTTAKPKMRLSSSTVFDGVTWYNPDSTMPGSSTFDLDGTKDLGEGWYEYHWIVDTGSDLDLIDKIKMSMYMTSSNVYATPIFARPRWAARDV